MANCSVKVARARKAGLDPGVMALIAQQGVNFNGEKPTGPIMLADQTNMLSSLIGPALQYAGGSRPRSMSSYGQKGYVSG